MKRDISTAIKYFIGSAILFSLPSIYSLYQKNVLFDKVNFLNNKQSTESDNNPFNNETKSIETILTKSGKNYSGDVEELSKEELESIRKTVNTHFLFDPVAYQTMWPVSNPLCKSPSLVENTFKIKVYSACNFLAKQEGLKIIKEMPADQGMLFIYNKEEELNFWMNKTYLPLSIAFLDKDFKVVHIAEMIPLDQTNISSIVPAKYALELNSGKMKELGIEEGVTLSFKNSNEKLSFIPEKRVEDQNYELELYMKYHDQ